MSQTHTTPNRWTDGTMFTQTSDLSPECIDRYMRRGRALRATAFRAMIRGESASAANDAQRSILKICASRFDGVAAPLIATA